MTLLTIHDELSFPDWVQNIGPDVECYFECEQESCNKTTRKFG